MEVKKLTSTERRAAIRANLEQLAQRMPSGWNQWGAERVTRFKADYREAITTPMGARMLLAVGRVCAAYGVEPATIDPNAGDAP